MGLSLSKRKNNVILTLLTFLEVIFSLQMSSLSKCHFIQGRVYAIFSFHHLFSWSFNQIDQILSPEIITCLSCLSVTSNPKIPSSTSNQLWAEALTASSSSIWTAPHSVHSGKGLPEQEGCRGGGNEIKVSPDVSKIYEWKEGTEAKSSINSGQVAVDT